MFFPTEPFLAALVCACLLVLASGCGLSVWLTGWRGKQAAFCIGIAVILSGIATLCMVSSTIPRYWWACLLPIYLGIQCIQIWRRNEKTRGIRLSSLLLTIGVLGATLGGAGQLYRHRRAEAPAVAKIESIYGIQVQYHFDGFASQVIFIESNEDELSEALSLLNNLHYLHRLEANHHKLSMDQANQIGRLVQLKYLGLQSTGFTDRMSKALSRLHNLESLDLMGNAITAETLKHLHNAQSMRNLWIDSDAISEEDKVNLRSVLPKATVD